MLRECLIGSRGFHTFQLLRGEVEAQIEGSIVGRHIGKGCCCFRGGGEPSLALSPTLCIETSSLPAKEKAMAGLSLLGVCHQAGVALSMNC